MPRYAANLSFLFAEHAFLDRFAAAADAGFEGVEYAFAYDCDPQAIRARLDQHGLTPALFNLPPGDWAAGDRGIACRPDRIEEFRAALGVALHHAETIGCPRLHCMAGIAPAGVPEPVWRQTLTDNLRFAADILAQRGITLMIEPINTRDMPGYAVNRSDDAAALIAQIGEGHAALQYDIYHMHVMGEDLEVTLSEKMPLIHHIQIADDPGRHEPGTGTIDFATVLPLIDKLGYQGWVGCEYVPADGTCEGLGWLHDSLLQRG